MYENEYGTPEGDDERQWRLDREAADLLRDMEPERAHLRAFGLPADRLRRCYGGEQDRHEWVVNLRRPETLALVEAAGFVLCGQDAAQRVGYIRRKPGPLVPRPATLSRALTELSALENLNAASFVIGGSRVWDGGRLTLPMSDVDVFVSVNREDLDLFSTTPCEAREWWLTARTVLPFPNCTINLVPAPAGHWALTGREESQQRVLRGGPISFKPAPGNAESSMIRRAALNIMGIELCAAGADVAVYHVLRGEKAVENAVRWVEARAEAWSDVRLAALASRVRKAMAHGEDVRAVL